MTTAEQFEATLDESKALIRRQLASINVHRPELEAMLSAYERFVREQRKKERHDG